MSWEPELEELRRREELARRMGGEERVARQHSSGRLTVRERIALYRSRVPTGRVRFNVHNFGEDGHDLAIRSPRGRLLGTLPEIEPGATATLVVRLRRPGRYTAVSAWRGTRPVACARSCG